jgi:hypothetical protein
MKSQLSLLEKPDASPRINETQRHVLLEGFPMKVDQFVRKELDFEIAVESKDEMHFENGFMDVSIASGCAFDGKQYRHHPVCHASMSLAGGLKIGESL